MTQNFMKADPAEGSREVIERELARRDGQERAKAKAGGADTAPLKSEDVATAIRDADDHLIAEIMATGANLHDLSEALAWLEDDDAVIEAGRAPPSGRGGEIVRLLRKADDMAVGGATDQP
jgi:hypothetical protein